MCRKVLILTVSFNECLKVQTSARTCCSCNDRMPWIIPNAMFVMSLSDVESQSAKLHTKFVLVMMPTIWSEQASETWFSTITATKQQKYRGMWAWKSWHHLESNRGSSWIYFNGFTKPWFGSKLPEINHTIVKLECHGNLVQMHVLMWLSRKLRSLPFDLARAFDKKNLITSCFLEG